MLFGFELFSALKGGLTAEIIEVAPVCHRAGAAPDPRAQVDGTGYRDQLAAVVDGLATTAHPGSPTQGDMPGSRHDRLDAYMAAWVATLPPKAARFRIGAGDMFTFGGRMIPRPVSAES